MTTVKKANSKKKSLVGDIVKTIHLRDDAVPVQTTDIVLREAPVQRAINNSDIVQPVMNDAQLSIMLNKTPAWAVKTRQGGGGKMYTYVPHGYVTDTLNKAFGFDWDLIIDPMADGKMYALEIEEVVNAQTKSVMKVNRHIAVTGRLIVRIHDPITGEVKATITKSGFGSQLWLPTMELGDSLKAARSDLLKTCAFQLGIALDLYWNERAEINSFEGEQRISEDRKKAEELLKNWEKRGVPTNFGSLLSKAKTDYNFDGSKIEEILKVELDEIMDYDPPEIVKAWDSIIAYEATMKSKKK